jgi:membrane protein
VVEHAPRPNRSALVRVLVWPLTIFRRLVGVVPTTIDMYFARRCPQHAAGIAYRVLFSLAPLAIILVSIFALVLTDDEIRERVIDSVIDALPLSDQGAQDVTDAITRIAQPASALGLLSLLVFAWAATGMMAAIRVGLEEAMGVDRSRPAARSKLVDVVLVLAVAVLVLSTVGLNLAVQIVTEHAQRFTEWLGIGDGGIGAISRSGVPVFVSTVVVMLLYRFVPARRLRFRDAVAGSFVTALLLFGVSLLSVYVLRKTSDLSVVYGSLTAALVFLYTVYMYATALLIGAVVAAAWAAPPSGEGGPFGAQLKRAARGLFVHADQTREVSQANEGAADPPPLAEPDGESR